jgi:hypothetical protein
VGGMLHFLLVYSYEQRHLVEQETFVDPVAATTAYTEAERRYRDKPGYEIVLVGSDSIETIMKTHGHYFAGDDDSLFSRFLLPA